MHLRLLHFFFLFGPAAPLASAFRLSLATIALSSSFSTASDSKWTLCKVQWCWHLATTVRCSPIAPLQTATSQAFPLKAFLHPHPLQHSPFSALGAALGCGLAGSAGALARRLLISLAKVSADLSLVYLSRSGTTGRCERCTATYAGGLKTSG